MEGGWCWCVAVVAVVQIRIMRGTNGSTRRFAA